MMGFDNIVRDMVNSYNMKTKSPRVCPLKFQSSGLRATKKYRLTLFDKRVIETDYDDKLLIFKQGWTGWRSTDIDKGWRYVNGDELLSLFLKADFTNTRSLLYLPLTFNFSEKDINLPIHPYVLGSLLGDGGLSRPAYITFASADIDIINRVAKFLPENTVIKKKNNSKYDWFIQPAISFHKTEFVKSTRDLNLRVTSDKKFIPEIYKCSSYLQKLELVRGLMDTDGTVGKNGGVSFSSCSKQLAEDLAQIIRDIGGIANICIKEKCGFTYKGEKRYGLPAYIIHIRFKTPRDLFSLSRKADKLPIQNQYSANLKLRINQVEIISE